jgi:ribosomal protein S30
LKKCRNRNNFDTPNIHVHEQLNYTPNIHVHEQLNYTPNIHVHEQLNYTPNIHVHEQLNYTPNIHVHEQLNYTPNIPYSPNGKRNIRDPFKENIDSSRTVAMIQRGP